MCCTHGSEHERNYFKVRALKKVVHKCTLTLQTQVSKSPIYFYKFNSSSLPPLLFISSCGSPSGSPLHHPVLHWLAALLSALLFISAFSHSVSPPLTLALCSVSFPLSRCYPFSPVSFSLCASITHSAPPSSSLTCFGLLSTVLPVSLALLFILLASPLWSSSIIPCPPKNWSILTLWTLQLPSPKGFSHSDPLCPLHYEWTREYIHYTLFLTVECCGCILHFDH